MRRINTLYNFDFIFHSVIFFFQNIIFPGKTFSAWLIVIENNPENPERDTYLILLINSFEISSFTNALL